MVWPQTANERLDGATVESVNEIDSGGPRTFRSSYPSGSLRAIAAMQGLRPAGGEPGIRARICNDATDREKPMKLPESIFASPALALAVLFLVYVPAMAGVEASDATVKLGGLEWARTTSGEDLRWPDAVKHCDGLRLGGHEDWRLPTLAELESLHDPKAEGGIREPFVIDTCCLWSSESLVDRPAEDGDEIGGSPEMYQWGFMFDGGHLYYAVHVFKDGQALCTRNLE